MQVDQHAVSLFRRNAKRGYGAYRHTGDRVGRYVRGIQFLRCFPGSRLPPIRARPSLFECLRCSRIRHHPRQHLLRLWADRRGDRDNSGYIRRPVRSDLAAIGPRHITGILLCKDLANAEGNNNKGKAAQFSASTHVNSNILGLILSKKLNGSIGIRNKGGVRHSIHPSTTNGFRGLAVPPIQSSFRSTRVSARQLIEPTPTQDHWHALFRPRCSGFCLLRR